ncbi:hypothetical protein A3K01_01720 [candidate division WWE3 bacterium RIFOXYD1_FULL_43_17]|uniref:Uncharacterized protein n=3 Tax=Katanobacteria TaxID=422282 RepID=A0A1F4XDQ6_UNCKA|nr:MAG: hypothetical protein UU59_C0023G0010 [candidate division WWE3 bacterium GW2011_GWE1_41_27]KKS60003.1 MAG: hypothetical protein UV26_C0011G0048 [candidate division WWE3 bacterium GW2011_GWF2_42_42]OGC79797.1 MAG: hypothetical protein A3K01_01720 [candidate division WWE3 bacterium RIFOXYD1_FULL_43_17]
MKESATRFRKSVAGKVASLKRSSESAANTIEAWLDLLIAEEHSAADAKLQELPRVSELSPNSLRTLAEIFASAVDFNLSIPK